MEETLTEEDKIELKQLIKKRRRERVEKGITIFCITLFFFMIAFGYYLILYQVPPILSSVSFLPSWINQSNMIILYTIAVAAGSLLIIPHVVEELEWM
ncbi:MAG: hypothetical protein AB1485_05600 [Candidatus Thermoplasmatota archaeon]